MDLTDNSRPCASHRFITAALVFAIAASAAGCVKTDPSSDPFKACPAGAHRVRDVTQPWPKQWVCER